MGSLYRVFPSTGPSPQVPLPRVASGTISGPGGAILSHSGDLLFCAEAWPYRDTFVLGSHSIQRHYARIPNLHDPSARAPGMTGQERRDMSVRPIGPREAPGIVGTPAGDLHQEVGRCGATHYWAV
jgi:hypothetical protein